ncbi:MAG: hypothetical protein DI539_11460 [Flavobacterium psychrophilum]|nr:MAG: hypothetical protein DI539_11460 [Flavobacterium psychrophilum]
MMLNILRKIKVAFIFFGFVFISISCKQNESYGVTIVTDKNEIDISESYFYENERGTVFYYIPSENKRKEVFENNNVKEIRFHLNDGTRSAKPILVSMFSRELPKSDFMFLVKRDTKKIVIDTLQKKAVMVIISNKTDINNLINNHELKAEKIK